MSTLTNQPFSDDILNEQHLDLDAQSPSKMAEAYLAAAMVERENNKHNKKTIHADHTITPKDILKGANNSSVAQNEYHNKDIDHSLRNTNDPEIQIESIWNDLAFNDNDEKELSRNDNDEQTVLQNEIIQKALNATTEILHSEIESLVRNGLEAFHGYDSTRRELGQMKDLSDSRAKECKRLQDSEAQSQLAVSVSFFL